MVRWQFKEYDNNLRPILAIVEVGCFGIIFALKNWPMVFIVTPIGIETNGFIRTAMMIERVIDASLLIAIKNKQKT